jgi:hypothetical protein
VWAWEVENVPSLGLIAYGQSHTSVLGCAWNQCVCIQQVKCLAKLPLCVSFELLTAHRQGFEKRGNSNCRSPLHMRQLCYERCLEVLHTCLATFELEFRSRPFRSISSIVPMGASLAVAVVRVTPSLRAHSEDNASPRKPKVKTVARSSKAASLDV